MNFISYGLESEDDYLVTFDHPTSNRQADMDAIIEYGPKKLKDNNNNKRDNKDMTLTDIGSNSKENLSVANKISRKNYTFAAPNEYADYDGKKALLNHADNRNTRQQIKPNKVVKKETNERNKHKSMKLKPSTVDINPIDMINL